MNKIGISIITCFCFYCTSPATNEGKASEILFQELIANSSLLQSENCSVTPAKDSSLKSFEPIKLKCARGYEIKDEALKEGSIKYAAVVSGDQNSVADFYWERVSSEEVHLKSYSKSVSGKVGFLLNPILNRDGNPLPALDYFMTVDPFGPAVSLKYPSGSYDESIFLSNTYDITFSEPVTGAMDLSNYKLDSSVGGNITIRNIAKLNELSYRIFWQGNYPRQGGKLSLSLKGIKDSAGNEINQRIDYQILGWKDGPNIIQPRMNFRSVQLSTGEVLILGGIISSTALKSVEGYKEADGVFVAKNDLTVARRLFTASINSSDEIVIAGGYTTNGSSSVTNTTDIYNPNTGTWAAGPTLSSTRISHASCTLSDGRVMISGGRINTSGPALNQVGIITLNHSGGGTITNYSMLVARYGHACVTLPNGLTWIVGYGKQTEYFDPTTNTFSIGPDLVAPQDSMVTIQDRDGNVYLIAGSSGLTTDIVQKFDWRTGKASIFGYLPRTLVRHAVAPLPDDSFLVVGGVSFPLTAPVEIPNVSKVWNSGNLEASELSSLKQARGGHELVRLPSGKIIVIGGAAGSGAVDYMQNTEIFGP
ncbi:hypothetical protein LPTSP3_g25510 [Leptospira kobayashii]|uniref:Kelch repeat protein n=1 Tax=Leptospira kobayashii TaxID=1917830 RepID=A0ABN6KHU1_9LEPT|nr:kelch repeat-containing protein [Leptospira kobayashii]BDA79621.1 hypothetical protein LPTSP3_g25510 [Leptospira kobayashii]